MHEDLLKVYEYMCGFNRRCMRIWRGISFQTEEDEDMGEDTFHRERVRIWGRIYFQSEDMGEDIFSKYVNAYCTYAY